MDKATIVITTLVVYKLGLLTIGWWAKSRNHDEEDFFLGGRGLGPLVAAISYSSSASSAWTLLGVSGIAYVLGAVSYTHLRAHETKTRISDSVI